MINKKSIFDVQTIISSFQFSTLSVKIIENDLSSNNKNVKKYDEIIEHKHALTSVSIYKIVQLISIEKRLNHTTVKSFESWEKKIDFLKSLKERANKKAQNKIIEHINKLKRIIKKLAKNRNKQRNDVIKIFSTTTQRIFAHNKSNTTKRVIRWNFFIESIVRILKVENVYSTQLFALLLSKLVKHSKRTLTKTNRALFDIHIKQATYNVVNEN